MCIMCTNVSFFVFIFLTFQCIGGRGAEEGGGDSVGGRGGMVVEEDDETKEK